MRSMYLIKIRNIMNHFLKTRVITATTLIMILFTAILCLLLTRENVQQVGQISQENQAAAIAVFFSLGTHINNFLQININMWMKMLLILYCTLVFSSNLFHLTPVTINKYYHDKHKFDHREIDVSFK